jgi:acetyl esterase/lipase
VTSDPAAVAPTPLDVGEALRPGVAAFVTEPIGRPTGVVVVLVPGGGWVSADPSGLAPLAGTLARAGALVVRLTYRTATEEAYYPDPVHDVGCGIAFAASRASAPPGTDRTIAVVGHSAGAQLAALAALDPGMATGPECPYPPARADLLVGLAGPYDVESAAGQARFLFGPANADPADWDPGNPVVQAADRPELPVLLVHGTADDLVPLRFSEQFADALENGGHPVDLLILDGVDHHSVYSPENAGAAITDWLRRLSA